MVPGKEFVAQKGIPLQVEFNQAFSVKPPPRWLRNLTFQSFRSSWGLLSSKVLYSVPLIGEDDYRGEIEFIGVMSETYHPENPIFPAGEPLFDMQIDQVTGLTLIRALPITLNIRFGPFFEADLASGLEGIQLAHLDKEFHAKPWTIPFTTGSDKKRTVQTLHWKEKEGENTGPMYFPSGTDFNQVELVIQKDSGE